MATAASYFSGTAVMPRAGPAAAADYTAGAGTPPPSKSHNPRYSGCVPATVLHIARSFAAAAAADDGGGDPVFSIDGVETSNVRVLGRVLNIVSRETDVSFTLDDGTGKIALVRWITDQLDARDTAYIRDGVYVRVHANVTGFQAKQQAFIRSIRPVTNFNEVVLHYIECMHVHMENTRIKMQGQLPPAVQTNAYTHEPGGVREHQVHFTPQVQQGQLPPAVRTNTSTYVPYSGSVREHQVHFTPQVNQFSSYSATSGQQYDLQSMVLGVLQAPDIISLENGIHIDEVARRTGAPKTNIMEVINFLADTGLLCWTIDDYHVKCTADQRSNLRN
ncbi:replication protein A 32 kDa subunit C isoform X2 [Brachypodium distachyon]|uniref:replication protein A 32 kDa subunit C isoform X2 n=1 Tax=Brachypodium distachyon TaxID=15368 RepID=UPI00071D4D32|nr:replication protein A 32 kDa subunit C isoform X2 [Brachypodium distachyon]|eukprot:XP_014752070.1 replication protein A 32 kDa subunit C isoform X2 [Brachypodium distachyon]